MTQEQRILQERIDTLLQREKEASRRKDYKEALRLNGQKRLLRDELNYTIARERV